MCLGYFIPLSCRRCSVCEHVVSVFTWQWGHLMREKCQSECSITHMRRIFHTFIKWKVLCLWTCCECVHLAMGPSDEREMPMWMQHHTCAKDISYPYHVGGVPFVNMLRVCSTGSGTLLTREKCQSECNITHLLRIFPTPHVGGVLFVNMLWVCSPGDGTIWWERNANVNAASHIYYISQCTSTSHVPRIFQPPFILEAFYLFAWCVLFVNMVWVCPHGVFCLWTCCECVQLAVGHFWRERDVNLNAPASLMCQGYFLPLSCGRCSVCEHVVSVFTW